MIRKIIYGIYAIIGMMVVTACSNCSDFRYTSLYYHQYRDNLPEPVKFYQQTYSL